MANPPITIGPFNNVPAPGSPIGSAWPQSITTAVTRLVKTYTVVGKAGSTVNNFPDIAELTVEAWPEISTVFLFGNCRMDISGGTGQWTAVLTEGGAEITALDISDAGSGGGVKFPNLLGSLGVAAGTPKTFRMGGRGSANITTYADLRFNVLRALRVRTM